MPCRASTSCRVVTPDDALIGYAGYIDLLVDSTRASFRRTFAGNLVGLRDGALQTPGATVRWRSDAESVDVVLQYEGSVHPHHCSETCAITNMGTCYSSACHARCAALLFVDGTLHEESTHHADGQYHGEVRIVAMQQEEMRLHEYELVMPWAAVVEFRRLELGSEHGTPFLTPNQPLPSFVYVAYGDSIVQGWCGQQPYPELIARRNGWQSINLGIAGMGSSAEDQWGHGVAIARAGGSLVSIAIGTNDFWWCGQVEEHVRSTVASLRTKQPSTPIVVITPTTAWYDGKQCAGNGGGPKTLGEIREAVRRAVVKLQARGIKESS